MTIRDRIREFRRVRADQLRPHPLNWRGHPPTQRSVMQHVLDEIGYADALLARELDDGTLELIDGHLRAELTPETEVPVLVLDLDTEEAQRLLALHDPLAALASEDQARFDQLAARVAADSRAFQALIAARDGDDTCVSPPDSPDVKIELLHQVLVQCDDEPGQRALFERLHQEGYRCRLLTL